MELFQTSTTYLAKDPELDNLDDLFKALVLCNLGCHFGVTCDSCSSENIFGYRYLCAICEDYNLCSNCFEDRKQTKDHQLHHPLLLIRSPDTVSKLNNFLSLLATGLSSLQAFLAMYEVTHDHTCNSCSNGQKIKGLLFICDDCRGFRICYKCYESGTHGKNHCLIVRFIPRNYKIQWDQITLQKKLGSGAFGEVHLCNIAGNLYAVKQSKSNKLNTLNERETEALENEIEIYQEFFCNYIVEIKGYGLTNNSIFMVLEYLSGGNLENHLRSEKYKNESKRRRFFFCENIIRGLYRMHKKGIVHKDLKPDNIFITEYDSLKLGDLGIAFHPDITKEGVSRLTQRTYYPKNDQNVSHPCYDIFAFGLLLNEIMTGRRNLTMNEADCRDIQKVPYFGPLISACVSVRPQNRPTTQCVKQYLVNFEQHLDDYIKQTGLNYEKQSLAKRNEIFDDAYNSFTAAFHIETDKEYQELPKGPGLYCTLPRTYL